MGRWGMGILEGDLDLDFRADFADVCKIDMYDKEEYFTKEILEKNERKLLKSVDKQEMQWYFQVGLQVLGLLFMEAGAKMSPDFKRELKKALKKDEWANSDQDGAKERKEKMDQVLAIVKTYKNKPTEIPSKGLMEKIAEGLGGENDI